MTPSQADWFWIAVLVVLAAFDIALFSQPVNLSFSSRVAYWSTHYPWIPAAYVAGAVFLYFHFWG